MPCSSYFKNHLGGHLTDEEFEDIPHPMTELVMHVTMKTVQAGTLLGTCAIAPVASLILDRPRNFENLSRRSMRYGRNGILIGLVAGPLATYMTVRNDPVEKITDRDYRLRHNRGQVRVDQGVMIGGLMGTGVNAVMGRPPLMGAVLGISGGILAMAFYNNRIVKN